MTGNRSKTDLSNLQEVADSGGDTSKGLAQYYTPSSIADEIVHTLRKYRKGNYPSTVIDPQAGGRALLNAFPFQTEKYAIDIWKPDEASPKNYIEADCRKVGGIIDDIYPDAVWDCGVANYPFGLRWKGMKPWEWTWRFLQRHTRYGCMIGAENEVGHLADDPSVWKTKVIRWPDADVMVRLLYYRTHNTDLKPFNWSKIEDASIQERNEIPPYNVWLKDSAIAGRNGSLGVFLSVRDKVKFDLSHSDAGRLMKLDGSTPQVLAVDRETRKLLKQLVSAGIYKIEPKADEAIRQALKDAERAATPIMPVTDFERVAYLDEEDTVTCVRSWGPFKEGEKYPVTSQNYTFRQHFTRRKPYYDKETGLMQVREHECTLSGQDRKVVIGNYEFMSNPSPDLEYQQDESMLWQIFARPPVLTVADRFPDKVRENIASLELMERFSNIRFYPGQMEYLSRVLVRDNALIAADVGCGKSAMAIAACVIKGAERCLILCPKGLAHSEEDQLSQWVEEISRFAPFAQVFKLFSYADYERITNAHDGVLPHGFYVTYYDAFLSNGAVETCSMHSDKTPRWKDRKLYDMVGTSELQSDRALKSFELVSSVGEENVEGIRCVAKPSLATLIGDQFDMVCMDEIHTIKNLEAQKTQIAIRLRAKYRFGFTATPVPNTAVDIFPIMGWICVDDWFKGGISSADFPFRREEFTRFGAIFLARERDHTAEEIITRRDPRQRRKVEKVSPVLSSPARLLKILKPAMAFITKKQCNLDYMPPRIVDVRVPLGTDQAALYGYFTDIGSIRRTIAGTGISNPLVRHSAQIEWLRAITTDPNHARTQARIHIGDNVPELRSHLNPKVMAIMELTANCIQNDEQVVIVNSRKGITDVLHNLLDEAGVAVSRIDSSERSGSHTSESNRFKAKETQVMLLGIKCAVGHSFDQCKNLIIASLEYSAGPFEQAKGRVDRLTSKESRIYCVLCSNTIEQVMFDTVAMKDDASKIILRGERVPRDFVPVDMSEVLMNSLIQWDQGAETMDEADCERNWPAIKESLTAAPLGAL